MGWAVLLLCARIAGQCRDKEVASPPPSHPSTSRPIPNQTAAGVTDLLDSVALEVSPLSGTPPAGVKAYGALVARLKKAMVPLLGASLWPPVKRARGGEGWRGVACGAEWRCVSRPRGLLLCAGAGSCAPALLMA